MNDELVQKIRNNPKYKELVKKRTAFAIKLGVFVLTMYYVYILVIAFNPALLAIKLSPESVMTLAFPVGAAIIIVCFITTLIYVNKANNEFEELTNQVKEDIKDAL